LNEVQAVQRGEARQGWTRARTGIFEPPTSCWMNR
jgi:hypothetical protein